MSYAAVLDQRGSAAWMEGLPYASGDSGDFLGTVLKRWFEAKLHLDSAINRQSAAAQFYELADTWRAETGFSSSVSEMVSHPAYQRIIGLGPAVLPMLLREVQDHQEHWYPALTAITGVNPVKPQDRGRIDAMAGAWMSWAKEQGLTW